ncbi:MAG: DUF134 domain-containing protein [Bullifex sp.]
MARPLKTRCVSSLPDNYSFRPTEHTDREPVVMTLDEFEALKLIDFMDMSQEEAALKMRVSRQSIQLILASARKKTASSLVDGRPLVIRGGNICFRDRTGVYGIDAKGDDTVRIAVTYDDGMIFQHFGHTESFKIYDTEDGKIKESKVIGTDGQGHGALATLLSGLDVDALICGGIGGGARMALAEAGITLYGGVSGNADAAVEALIRGELDYNPDVMCTHHHGEGHTCGHSGNCSHHE